ncbi:50S ribosomal protein L28 [Spirochaeta africana]|uniref:Large ribosomal subunit protein bL28 n=1 Tax=Spirochaeta africana (strain ATCC 700263 / DSM 8902 / Z-7692) TaxID=889378 RepID=H9UMR4_SPIAZ|nr:50S ribosomal protein L28 [Spirochaeta africana]AFG38807.1 ribosomal protein L28 [Spirochaeta africana DSM 8902]
MPRRCRLTGKGTVAGNNVSHAMNHSRRVQKANLQYKRLFVPELNRFVRVRLSARALRTVSKVGLMQFMRKQGLSLKDVTK